MAQPRPEEEGDFLPSSDEVVDRPQRRPRGTTPSPEASASKPGPPVPLGSRDLKLFEELDPSPSRRNCSPYVGDGAPSALGPIAWDGRHLDTLAESNFPRGGHSTLLREVVPPQKGRGGSASPASPAIAKGKGPTETHPREAYSKSHPRDSYDRRDKDRYATGYK